MDAYLLARFDYTLLDAHTRQLVQKRTNEIKGLVKHLAKDTIWIGKNLIEVKELLPHGMFSDWVRDEFDWSQDTAERFMNVARWAEQNPQIADFGFGPSALYLLAKPSTPESARQDAIQRAESGEMISHAKAKAIVQAHKQSPDQGFLIGAIPTAQRPIPPPLGEMDLGHSSLGDWIDRIYNEVSRFQNLDWAGELGEVLTDLQRRKLLEIIGFLQCVESLQ